MTKLLSANILRLWKNKFFWIGMVFMAVLGIFLPINEYLNIKRYSDYMVHLDDIFFDYVVFIGILLSIFCSLFIGTEYSDGTIRNKVVIGHSRIAIYLSNLFVSVLAGLLMCSANLLLCFGVGTPLLGFFAADMKSVFIFVADSLIMMIAFSAIYTFIAMLCSSKAISGIVCVLGVFVCFCVNIFISSELSLPESYLEYYIDDGYTEEELAEIIAEGGDKNPFYVRGTKRQIYEFLDIFLPTGQVLHIVNFNWNPEHTILMPIYSILIIIVTTGGGLICFHKKDLK